MPRSFAAALPLGGLALAVVVAAGAGIAAAPSSDDAHETSVVMRHHGHDRMQLRHERRHLEKQLEKLSKHGFRGKGPRGDGPPGLLGGKRLERSPAFALLPDALQDDLRDALKADPDERRALLETIRRKALAGDYGPKVAEAYRLLQQHHGG